MSFSRIPKYFRRYILYFISLVKHGSFNLYRHSWVLSQRDISNFHYSFQQFCLTHYFLASIRIFILFFFFPNKYFILRIWIAYGKFWRLLCKCNQTEHKHNRITSIIESLFKQVFFRDLVFLKGQNSFRFLMPQKATKVELTSHVLINSRFSISCYRLSNSIWPNSSYLHTPVISKQTFIEKFDPRGKSISMLNRLNRYSVYDTIAVCSIR